MAFTTPNSITKLEYAVDASSLNIAPALATLTQDSWDWNTSSIADNRPAIDGLSVSLNLPVEVQAALSLTFGAIEPSAWDSIFNTVHLIENEIDAGAVVADEEHTFELYSTYRVPKPVTISATGDDGITISGFISQTLSPMSSVIYTAAISSEGNPQIDALYTVAIDGETYAPTLAIIGDRMIVFPFKPLSGIKETFGWVTDVIQTYTDEQRIQLRAKPSHMIEMGVLLTGEEQTRLNNIATAWGSNIFGVPVWTEAKAIGALAAGVSSVTVDTTLADFRVDGMALIWESTTNYEAVNTTAISSTVLTLGKATVNTYTNAQVLPLRSGYLSTGGLAQSRMTDLHTKNTAIFKMLDLVELSAGSYTQYGGYDVMLDPSVSVTPLKASIVTPHGFIDNRIGTIASFKKRDVTVISDSFNWVVNTQAARWAMLQWIHSRKGRAVPFWLPSWRKDFVLLGTITNGTDVLTVGDTDARHIIGRHIMLKLVDGTIYYREIIGVTKSGGNEILQVDSNLPQEILVADIDRISRIDLVRYNSDNAKITHDAPSITKLSLPMVTFNDL